MKSFVVVLVLSLCHLITSSERRENVVLKTSLFDVVEVSQNVDNSRFSNVKTYDVSQTSQEMTFDVLSEVECLSFCDEMKCPSNTTTTTSCHSFLICRESTCRCRLKCLGPNSRPRRDASDEVVVEYVTLDPISLDLAEQSAEKWTQFKVAKSGQSEPKIAKYEKNLKSSFRSSTDKKVRLLSNISS